jgi:hypothetical protein
MLEALEKVAGKEVASLVTVKPDPTITKIVGGWPSKFDLRAYPSFWTSTR